jgi:hypothetical protein
MNYKIRTEQPLEALCLGAFAENVINGFEHYFEADITDDTIEIYTKKKLDKYERMHFITSAYEEFNGNLKVQFYPVLVDCDFCENGRCSDGSMCTSCEGGEAK